MAKVVGHTHLNKRKDVRHKLDHIDAYINNQKHPVQDISLGGILLRENPPGKDQHEEFVITGFSCRRNIIKGIHCKHDSSDGTKPVNFPFLGHVRFVRRNGDTAAGYRFVRLNNKQFDKLSACATCGLNSFKPENSSKKFLKFLNSIRKVLQLLKYK